MGLPFCRGLGKRDTEETVLHFSLYVLDCNVLVSTSSQEMDLTCTSTGSRMVCVAVAGSQHRYLTSSQDSVLLNSPETVRFPG